MFRNLVDNQNPHSLAARLRRKRHALLHSLLARLEKPIHILDAGGTEVFWRMSPLPDRDDVQITLLNLQQVVTSLPNVVSVAGDARDMRFPNLHFDVVFSNSVIEHLGSFEGQQQMAREIMRVGKRHFVQTPNRYFPIEPHFVFPMYQFLPRTMQVWLLEHFNLGWIKRTPNRAEAAALISGIRLLDKAEFRMLFPGSEIFEEKLLGFTKSLVAYGGWEIPPASS